MMAFENESLKVVDSIPNKEFVIDGIIRNQLEGIFN
jgi:hypothetical protein